MSDDTQPTLQEIAERQGLVFVEGAGIYSETGDLLLQLHPDPEQLHDLRVAYAIPEVVEWAPVHSAGDPEGLYTWSTVFTKSTNDLHYFTALDPMEDSSQIEICSWDEVPDLRGLVAGWRAQAEEKQDG